jgi:drug/metabolite transporter (DMT)-like permease
MNQAISRPILTGYLCVLAATIFWSGNFIIARDLNGSVAPVSLAFGRWLVAVLVLFPFAIKSLIGQWALVKENLAYLSITAFTGITLFNTLLYFGGQTTDALVLALISITSPIFIIIFARIFYGELLTFAKVAGILLVVTGVLVLITRGHLTSLLNLKFAIGDLWMLAGAIVFAIYSILIIKKPPQLGARAFQLSTFMLGLFFLLPLLIWEYAVVGPSSYDSNAVFSIIYLGIFASLFSFMLWNKAISLIGVTKTGMVYYTLPIFSGLMAWHFLGEDIGWLHLASGVLIISGILMANRSKK